MMGLGTAFKKVYGEVLAPYGYKKVKGGKPYFVRVVSDEVVHVMMYIPCPSDGYKKYMICGSPATVYRKKMDFSCHPAFHGGWVTNNLDICLKINSRYPTSLLGKFISSYPPNNEEKLLKSMWESVEQTREYLLPVLEKVTDLRSCIDYYHTICRGGMGFYFSDDFGNGLPEARNSDWLACFKVFTFEEFKELKQTIYDQDMEKYKEKIKNNELTETDKFNIEWDTNRLKRHLTGFEAWTRDLVLHKRMLDEMEKRKAENIEALRSYGIEI